MADTGIFCTTAEVLRKAGYAASATSSAEAYTNDFVTQAESYINAFTRINYSDTYSTLNVDTKALLKECASNIAACYVIMYDPRNFSSLAQVQTIINYLWDRTEKCLAILTNKDTTSFVSEA